MNDALILGALVAGILLGYGFSAVHRRWRLHRQRRNFKPRLLRPYPVRNFPVITEPPERAANE